jgi:hypothetical protein
MSAFFYNTLDGGARGEDAVYAAPAAPGLSLLLGTGQ